jgi:hypothetical protein
MRILTTAWHGEIAIRNPANTVAFLSRLLPARAISCGHDGSGRTLWDCGGRDGRAQKDDDSKDVGIAAVILFLIMRRRLKCVTSSGQR